MAFAVLLAGTPQGDALIQQTTVDLGRFANHHPHAVVDEHAVADAGTGVNLNPGQGTANLAEAAAASLVCCRSRGGGLFGGGRSPAGIAAHNFQPATGSRITLADDREVGTDVIKHRRGVSWRRPVSAGQSPCGEGRSYRC